MYAGDSTVWGVDAHTSLLVTTAYVFVSMLKFRGWTQPRNFFNSEISPINDTTDVYEQLVLFYGDNLRYCLMYTYFTFGIVYVQLL